LAQKGGSVRMFRSDAPDERALETEPLKDADAFVRFVITQERSLAGRAA
jgi:hypothetical protein